MSAIIGWDIGGAHVKAARAEGGVVVAAAQIPCAPHLGLAELEAALRAMRDRMGAADRHAVTMTAELSDAFADRRRGVISIAAIFSHELSPDALFYAGARGFVEKQDVAIAAGSIASANWRAPAELLAREMETALLIDMGSTTTDLTLVRDGRVMGQGEDDASRLALGELVYAGLLRGDPAAGLSLAPIDGRWAALMDERFATMADVRRLTGDLSPETDALPAVDGRSKSPDDTRARLARLVGRDVESGTPQQWDALARFFARAQLRRIEDAIALAASREPAALSAPIVGAGIGRGVIADFAKREGRGYRDFSEFLPVAPAATAASADFAPACAVALLAKPQRAGASRVEQRG
ncbi:hydantoinase/oxoprolinase family protein [Methylocystis bryophila]|uniref:H4MPT-linked C1 transfer pathway protein n=1 Tax=Methylocystis bryophila TaxID=655015 RepID=A0A1W6N1X7_9HYPH|nr:hydantoinase/oxoprolinase family protein [Methylocystis bryophila]ARN83761.1 H4MPT-linked C1 transfer pathway protein [Methylocystis bryophila]